MEYCMCLRCNNTDAMIIFNAPIYWNIWNHHSHYMSSVWNQNNVIAMILILWLFLMLLSIESIEITIHIEYTQY
jgi:hypothetical protein